MPIFLALTKYRFYLALIIATKVSHTLPQTKLLFCVTWTHMVVSFHLTFTRLPLMCCVQLWVPWYKKEKLEQAQQRASMMTGISEHMHTRRCQKTCLDSDLWREGEGVTLLPSSSTWWAGGEKTEKLLLDEHSNRTQTHTARTEEPIQQVPLRVVYQWNQCPRTAVESSSLEILKLSCMWSQAILMSLAFHSGPLESACNPVNHMMLPTAWQFYLMQPS